MMHINSIYKRYTIYNFGAILVNDNIIKDNTIFIIYGKSNIYIINNIYTNKINYQYCTKILNTISLYETNN